MIDIWRVQNHICVILKKHFPTASYSKFNSQFTFSSEISQTITVLRRNKIIDANITTEVHKAVIKEVHVPLRVQLSQLVGFQIS